VEEVNWPTKRKKNKNSLTIRVQKNTKKEAVSPTGRGRTGLIVQQKKEKRDEQPMNKTGNFRGGKKKIGLGVLRRAQYDEDKSGKV